MRDSLKVIDQTDLVRLESVREFVRNNVPMVVREVCRLFDNRSGDRETDYIGRAGVDPGQVIRDSVISRLVICAFQIYAI